MNPTVVDPNASLTGDPQFQALLPPASRPRTRGLHQPNPPQWSLLRCLTSLAPLSKDEFHATVPRDSMEKPPSLNWLAAFSTLQMRIRNTPSGVFTEKRRTQHKRSLGARVSKQTGRPPETQFAFRKAALWLAGPSCSAKIPSHQPVSCSHYIFWKLKIEKQKHSVT